MRQKKQEMHRITCLSITLLLVPIAAFAQTPQFQLYGGYAYAHVDSGGVTELLTDLSRNWNGWEASFATNFTRFVGVNFDFSGDYGSSSLESPENFTPRLRQQTQTPFFYSYMAGPQFLLPAGPFLVFAHAMAGATQMKREFAGPYFPVIRSDIAFGSVIGAGIDLNLTQYVALRIAQADYLISKNFGGEQNNLRVSGGIVFKFGSR